MPYDADPLYTTIRSVIEGSSGSVRTVPAGRLRPLQTEDESPAAIAKLCTNQPRYRLDIGVALVHASSPPENHSVAIYEVPIDVATYRKLKHYSRAAASRDTNKALAAEDAELVREALCWSGNVPSGSTGVISSQLESTGARAVRESPEEKLIEITQTFRALVVVATPVS